jgi:hypothetical protein
MAEYESIHGTRVKYLSSDPTLTDSSTEGQVWYNSTSGTNKALVQIKAVSSGANIPTNFYYSGGVGPTTATLGISGVGPSPQPAHNLVIQYNGFTWTSENNIPVSSRAGYDFGTATAAVYAGGDYSPASPTITAVTREYDGSSWTTGNNIPSGQGSFGAATGVLTAGLCFGGYNGPQTASSAVTVSYDGTNWTDLPSPSADTNTLRNFTRGGGGPQTAAIFSGGNPTTGATEAFDGSSWTSLNSMNTARYGSGFNGTQGVGVYMGGVAAPGRVTTIEEWDGVNWSTSPATLATATNGTINSKGGSVSNNIIAGGWPSSGAATATQVYNSNINALTQAVWSAGGTVNTIGDVSAGAGTMNAGLKFGGYPPSGGGVGTTATEEYNGSSWTSVNSMNTAGYGLTGTGLQTAAVRFGGYSGTNLNNTEEYDGTNWTAVTAVPTTISSGTAFGIQTAAVLAGGYDGSTWQQDALEYDGTNFSSGGTFPSTTGAQYAGSAGTQTAGLYFGGYVPGSALGVTTISYDGSSWSAQNNMLISRYTSGSGTQTAALAPGGYQNTNSLVPAAGYTLACEQYDGTNWSNTCNNNITRGYQISSNRASNAPGTTGLVFGGSNNPSPGNTNTSEEFTGGTEVVTASTLTTS